MVNPDTVYVRAYAGAVTGPGESNTHYGDHHEVIAGAVVSSQDSTSRRREVEGSRHSVTSAAPNVAHDRDLRLRNYLIAMGIRTLCFFVAVWTLVIHQWWIVGSIAAAGAILLPYIAVVLANNVDKRTHIPAKDADAAR